MQISRISKVDLSTTEHVAASRSFKSANSPVTTSNAPAEVSFPLAQINGSPNSVRVSSLTASHSTTVAGKSYSLTVEESGGTYVASVPNPPGASATGSSPQVAEINLDIKLDTLA